MCLAQEMPDELRRVQDLDADFAEALWVLGQPSGRFNIAAMTRETLASLSQVEGAREEFLGALDDRTRERLEDRVRVTRNQLSPEDAYLDIPGMDPSVRPVR